MRPTALSSGDSGRFSGGIGLRIRAWIWKVMRGLVFRIDAETAHELVGIQLNLLGRLGIAGRLLLRAVSGAKPSRSLARPRIEGGGEMKVDSTAPPFPRLELPLGKVGLAAGFDKNARFLPALPHLGFSFAEIGTVTPRPQAGNPRPRLFRDVESQSLFNRMGFNNLGATCVAANLERARKQLPPGFRVGVNIGKNKETPNEQASGDYVRAAIPFRDLADFVVLNVSSPNTPGLRGLQSFEAIRPLVEKVKGELASWTYAPPLLIKLAPELLRHDLEGLIPRAEHWGVDGWVLTNTWAGTYSRGAHSFSGGWSGEKLRVPALEALKSARALSTKTLISVGGIASPEEARQRVEAGADALELYSGWVFRGPTLPVSLERALRP